MSMTDEIKATLSSDKPISVAILAMGGQGGGVLADWIVAMAESQNWVAQSTSVPGVAQRTGATIYYLELVPARAGFHPTLSLMPTPGDVDIIIAAELMEAGRSVLRGLVTPDKTTLIASTHRAFAIAEKERPGDGIGNPETVVEATDFAAMRTIAFDMEQVAIHNGSVISAALFGALAASGTLPFAKDAYEAIIKAGGKGIEPSIKTFRAAFDRANLNTNDPVNAKPVKRLDAVPETTGHIELDRLVTRIRAEFPGVAGPMLFAGVRKLVDYQDPAYGLEYLDRMKMIFAADRDHGGRTHGFEFTVQSAKYLANAMAYDDVIRVADLKIRSSRFGRVRKEIGASDDQIVYTTEYMHPRMEEVCGTLPEKLGMFIEARPKLFAWLDKRVNKGRRVNSGSVRWFLALSFVAGLRTRRRTSLRHAREMAHLEHWLSVALRTLSKNYDLAVEVIGCRRLVKGYSDTHARGLSKFDRVLSALGDLETRDDGAAWMRRLKQAALLDEDGIALDGALKTIASL